MRLWHVDLLKYLPKGQLLSQWRELNSIFAKEDKHILINYIYEYSKNDLYVYTEKVIEEMKKRGYQIRSYEKMNKYFENLESVKHVKPFKNHHDNEYLQICYYNLKEKFIRGQKDFEEEMYNNLCWYVNDILKNSIDGFK
ncbi:pyrimidine dimer DNA glycosylase/endonuclease V [Lysinibacillus pakistanensis]|uniref:Pyrimidine dimer DNA glycosylase/endonuclease V n=1 Tax=Lysinibacillus pakistanensis TaxID=759811 RepID=A0AAX3WZF9_9BACI|nr:pyrimidine dimer DNA glycosylase/endonuclease V [Lysinibacillus pakistanensis]MDM5232819.1 pyrimidine dimer DNA glycosylase/endonuclease V [Lysinibacillus pakistanensis]WHY48317.1 pyrimidine dimer DNA glycosylase/endonuclease V [Lysinibacillus pakistanensis]WHY53330.1 pyrimidine dimer DNA glycosylase/endonuclease V [Lysinibacillus pakistanensis]